MVRISILLGFALLVLTGAWLALSDPDAGAEYEVVPSPATPQADPGPEPADLAPSAEREDALQALSDVVELRVVLGDAGPPLAGVTVSFIDADELPQSWRADPRTPDLRVVRALETSERSFRSDEEGWVLLPRPRTAAYVGGAHEELAGVVGFRANEDEPVLRLGPTPLLKVRVVDKRGRPRGGVPVALCRHPEPIVSGTCIARSDPATGIARLRHLSTVFDGRPGEEGFARLAFPLSESVESSFDPAALPEEPLSLVLPPSGTLEVSLENVDGSPFSPPCVVRLSAAAASGGVVGKLADAHAVDEITRGGRAVFSHVGLDLRLALRIEPSNAFEVVTRRVQGPASADSVVRISVVMGGVRPTVKGRLLRPDGQPAVMERFETLLRTEGGPVHQPGRTRTDAEGHFGLHFAEDWLDGGPNWIVISRPGEGEPLAARAELPASAEELTEFDLGDLRLEIPPLAASGTVRDQERRPISGARIVATELSPPSEAGGPSRPRRPPIKFETSSGEDGTFVLRQHLGSSLLALRAQHVGYSSMLPVECSAGDKNIVLQLSAAGRLSGRVLLDPDVPSGLFDVSATRTTVQPAVHSSAVAKNGAFEISGLAAGAYLVSIGLRHEPSTRETFESVILQAGREITLPDVDLRHRVRMMTLDVRTEDGRPPANGLVRRGTARSGQFGPRAEPLVDGRLRVATLLPWLDLRVDAPAYRPKILENVTGDLVVELEAAASIRIVLEGGPPKLSSTETLGVALQSHGGSTAGTGVTAVFDELGVAETTIREPGLHDIRILLWREGETGGSSLVSSRLEATLHVGEGETLAIRISEETLALLDTAP